VIRRGLRAVALFEAAKGTLVLAMGFGLLAAAHRDLQALAAELIAHLHLNPASRYPEIFLRLARQLSDTRLQLLALGAAAYAAIRFAEAYGLWRERAWAEWLAVISAGIYLPFEIYELAKGVSTLRIVVFAINVAILAYLSWVLSQRHKYCN
jgi:uncharacterized membrane protein (DUF2068 family)